MTARTRLLLSAVIFPAALLATVARAETLPVSPIEAVTRPSDDRSLSFVHPGRVGEMFVKEGQRISKDEVLARQDDTEELSQLKQAQMQADDEVRMHAQDAQLQQKKADLKKIEWSLSQHAATEFEKEHAVLDVTIAELSLALSAFEHKVDGEKAVQAQNHIEEMTIKAPFDGLVETISAKAGESTEQNTKVLRVVNVDKLWIDVACPTALARTLDKKSSVSVQFSDRVDTSGAIILIGAVADAASDTLLVRVELPNPSARPAGEHVKVSFPDAKVASR